MEVPQVEYTYDDIGNVTSVKDKKGNVTNYEYDNCSRLSKVSYTVAGSAKYTSYSYDDNGNRNLITYSGGVKEEYVYDKNNRLLTLKNKKPDGCVISSYTYTYDLSGRQISKADSYRTTNYSYDALGRIERITAPGKTTVYAYDNVGNRISLDETYTSDQVSEYKNYYGKANISYKIKGSQYMYSNSNKLLQVDEAMTNSSNEKELQRSISFDYDNNGNEIKQTVVAKIMGKRKGPIEPPPRDFGDLVIAQNNSDMEISQMKKAEISKQDSGLYIQPGYRITNVYRDKTYSTTNEYDGFNRLRVLTKSGFRVNKESSTCY